MRREDANRSPTPFLTDAGRLNHILANTLRSFFEGAHDIDLFEACHFSVARPFNIVEGIVNSKGP